MNEQLLEIKQSKTKGRGLYAKTIITKGTIILSLHQKYFIYLKIFAQHPYFYLINNVTTNISKIVSFAFLMAYVQKSAEKQEIYEHVRKYESNLPQYYHNLICWSEKQLQKLDNQDLVKYIMTKKERIQFSFDQLLVDIRKQLENIRSISPLFKINSVKSIRRGSRCYNGKIEESLNKQRERILQCMLSIALEDVIRYVCVVESRSAYYPNQHDLENKVGALVPELELFNHSMHSKCKVELYHGCYRVVVMQDIFEGQQVCVNYENHSIEKFLQLYGMIPLEQDPKYELQACKSSEVRKLSTAEIQKERQLLVMRYNCEWKRAQNISNQND